MAKRRREVIILPSEEQAKANMLASFIMEHFGPVEPPERPKNGSVSKQSKRELLIAMNDGEVIIEHET